MQLCNHKSFTVARSLYHFIISHYIYYILGVIKRNPLFLHEIEWKNNGFLFIIPNISYKRMHVHTSEYNSNKRKILMIY